MLKFGKFVLIFFLYGTIWYFLFSIPVSEGNNLFIVLNNTLKLEVEKKPKKSDKKIDREQVIDALTHAFSSGK